MRNLILLIILFFVAIPLAADDKARIEIDDSCRLNLIDPLQFSHGWLAPPWCFGGHPAARDIWSLVDQVPAIDTERYDVGGENSIQQGSFFTRGGNDTSNLWFYDGVEVTDPVAPGATGTYFDYGTFSDLEILTGGAPMDVQTGGAVVRIVTGRAGNTWSGNASFFFSGDELQSDNTPGELRDSGIDRASGLDKYLEYGVDAGGKVITDRLFVWGAFRRNEVNRILQEDVIERGELNSTALKALWTPDAAQKLEFEYFLNDKSLQERRDSTAQLAPETLRNQEGSDTILRGIWKGAYSWVPNDRWYLSLMYGYAGSGFSLIPAGGSDVPVIYLASIPRYESTYVAEDPIDRPSHQVSLNASANHKLGATEHDWRFGFEYRTSSIESRSSYGNGVLIADYYQTVPGGPLTSGYLYAQRPTHYKANVDRASFYIQDTVRWKRVAVDAGFRIDHQSGENDLVGLSTVPGYESFLPVGDVLQNMTPVSFSDVSPRIHFSLDATGDGKTLIQAGYARYFEPLLATTVLHVNPEAVASGAIFGYTNRNGDRSVTPDELTAGPFYYGNLWIGQFCAFPCPENTYDPSLTNARSGEWHIGVERELPWDAVLEATYLHRTYDDFFSALPEYLTSADYAPVGTLHLETVLGTFQVPYYSPTAWTGGERILTNVQDYSQTYNGFDLNVRMRSGKYAEFSGGVVLQRQTAHYDSPEGLAFPIEDGGLRGSTLPFDPTNAPFLEGHPYAYSAGGSGVYPYSEWQFKFTGTAHLPAGVDAGAFVRYQQGYPYVLFARLPDCFECVSSRLILVEPFGSRRYDSLFSVDLQFQKQFDLGEFGRITGQVDISNVTNTNTVTSRQRLAMSRSLNGIVEYVSPRVFRFGLRYSF